MTSPLQQVPSTPVLRDGAPVAYFRRDSPSAVVPELAEPPLSQDSYIVPRTPETADRSSDWSPWIRSPSLRSPRREHRAQRNVQRFSYNPYRTPRFLPSSPYAPSPAAQVVPATPTGAFVPPSPNTPVLRTRRSTPSLTPRNNLMANVRRTPTCSVVPNNRRTPNNFISSPVNLSISKATPRANTLNWRQPTSTCALSEEDSGQCMNLRRSLRHEQLNDNQPGYREGGNVSPSMETSETASVSVNIPLATQSYISPSSSIELRETPRRAAIQIARRANDNTCMVTGVGNGSPDLIDILDRE